MCGFFGSFSYQKNKNLLVSSQKLDHRGPDDMQSYEDDNLKCVFFRLKILGGNKDIQPMLSDNKRWLMLFNGEVYNYLELGEELNMSKLKNISDTKIILEQFAKFGINAVEKFNGMFAIILYDRIEKKIFLIRDRLGTKPLYYCIQNNVLYFASEIKSLPVKKEPSNIVIDDYLLFGKYPRVSTFYKNIYNAEPSTITLFYKNNIKKNKYFFLREEVDKISKKKIDIEEYFSLLENSIRIRQRSNPKINIHFSGGIDSTALLILTKKFWKKYYALETFSFSYKNYKNDEYNYIKNISKKIKVANNKILICPKEIPDLAKKLQFYQDEPYGGLASIAEYKLNIEQKKNNNIISFEGVGGDEILGGYKSHYLLAIRDLFYSKKDEKLMKMMILNSKMSLKNILNITEKFIKSNYNGNTDLSQIRYYKNENKYKLKNKNFFDEIKFHDIENGSLYRTLRFRDRSSAACGRELRFPFLDHKFLVYSLALPMNIKFANGLTKSPLRNIVQKSLPTHYNLPKRSVSSPQTLWLKNELKDWAMYNIKSLKSKNIIDKKFFNNINSFFKYENKNSFYIWQLINLNLFYENLKAND